MKPRLAITMGDPTGVGAEVIAGVWGEQGIHGLGELLVIGAAETMERACRLRGLPAGVVKRLGDEAAFGEASPDCVPVFEPPELRGQTDPLPGEVAYQAIRHAAQMCLAGECDAVVTGPISKANLQAAGHDYPGHTELLAELCGVDDFAMMLYLPPGDTTRCPHGLGVVHTTLHTSLRSVFDQLTTAGIAAKCRLADTALRRFGAQRPRVAVAALNPHGGEDGLFGDEEIQLIRPAVEQAASDGLNVTGPWPVDTLMGRAAAGEFDAVVAMYHDQGHIALKLLGMHAAVNVTLGLPIVRTSVAHGTAPDLAWKGVAETDGMIAALRAASQLAGSSEREQSGAPTPD
ncbi:MAG: 4-hydroxythreonine-4-phosphate dehydrogenase PdxA [Planctomycetota bacterium]